MTVQQHHCYEAATLKIQKTKEEARSVDNCVTLTAFKANLFVDFQNVG